MRISELSRRTDVPVATIRYYLREHLLPPSRPTGRNQAEYDERHLQRLLLIRALTNIGDLDLSSVRQLLNAIAQDDLPLTTLYEVVHRYRPPSVKEPTPSEAEGVAAAQDDVEKLVDERGWLVERGAESSSQLAHILATLKRLGCEHGVDFFVPYAEAAERLAMQELDLLPTDGKSTDWAAAVARNVLLGSALVTIQRMAQEHYLALRFGAVVDRPTA